MKKILILLVIPPMLLFGCASQKDSAGYEQVGGSVGKETTYPLRRDTVQNWTPNMIKQVQLYLGAGFDLVATRDSTGMHVDEDGSVVYLTIRKGDIIHYYEGTKGVIIATEPDMLWILVQFDDGTDGGPNPPIYFRPAEDKSDVGVYKIRTDSTGFVPYAGIKFEPTITSPFVEWRVKTPIEVYKKVKKATGVDVRGKVKEKQKAVAVKDSTTIKKLEKK